jgi:hypothetical protein
MSHELSRLALDEDFEEVLAVEDSKRWILERSGPLEVLASMSPASATSELFQARFLWTVYPGEPPSLKFRAPHTGRFDDPTAWPRAGGFRPKNLDTCVSLTAEGFAHHPEWRNDPVHRWESHGNVLLKVLRFLQDALDNDYQGRFTK